MKPGWKLKLRLIVNILRERPVIYKSTLYTSARMWPEHANRHAIIACNTFLRR